MLLHTVLDWYDSLLITESIISNYILVVNKNHPNYGKHRSNETKRKISIANSGSNNGMYGTHHSKEHNNHVSKLVKLWKANISAEYRKHKESGGTLSWNEFQSFYKNKGRDA